eukprot:3877634-Amphidinium_carterae.1
MAFRSQICVATDILVVPAQLPDETGQGISERGFAIFTKEWKCASIDFADDEGKAGWFWSSPQEVVFVASPQMAPASLQQRPPSRAPAVDANELDRGRITFRN